MEPFYITCSKQMKQVTFACLKIKKKQGKNNYEIVMYIF